MLTGEDAAENSQNDMCPSCGQRDGIRFLGSAIATLLSVTMSNLFGSPDVDPREKKALVFADSVQDAAHHAGFIAARSHSITLRAVLREALGDEQLSLSELAGRVLEQARDDPFRRYRILPTELAGEENKAFWASPSWSGIPQSVRTTVSRRLLFDAILEFGLSGHFGRTLERTGSAWAQVGAVRGEALGNIAQGVLAAFDQDRLGDPLAATPADMQVRWVRGVLERMRTQGAIDHTWFKKFIENDGNRFHLWAGRPRGEGMPAFPTGRSIPGFPYVGGPRQAGARASRMELDPVTGSQSWYADWTARVLGVDHRFGGALAKDLLAALETAGILASQQTRGSGRTVYKIPADRVLIGPVSDADLAEGRVLLRCDVCQTPYPGSPETVADLASGPCLAARCPGHLRPEKGDPHNAYRTLYRSSDMRRVIAREHTSLLSSRTRSEYETAFKYGSQDPAAPNVLVATPTLEMGIDIGDLSAVFLAGLPRHVANYVQRVGRAGRLTGNSLDMAYVRGRGEFLPRLGEPESLINGDVQPPATYLSAEEILKRQYLAHVADGLARDDVDAHHPRTIAAAMNADPGGYLDGLILAAEQPGRIDTFLAAFENLEPEAVTALRGWAVPGDAPGHSGLAAMVYEASRAWSKAQETLRLRKNAILKVIADLDQRAAVSRTVDDRDEAAAAHAELDLVDKRLARSALNLVNRQIAETGTEYWISALEEYGLLPNYTLLDDSVTLDVAMSWYNPDSGAYEHEPDSFQRGSAAALREFAPGATFYAHGYAVKIDSVELGANAEAVHTWAFCPRCGYATDVAPDGREKTVTVCPRCDSEGIGDSGSRMEVLEFTSASANVNRDSSRITDSSDERVRTSFNVILAADVDPARIAHQWFVDGTEFGAKLVNGLTLRWLNLGRRVEQGTQRTIAGADHFAPLFRVCEGCGHIDTQSRANTRAEHAPWCRYRDDPAEHNRALALSRTLTTQGVLMPLPWSVTTGDEFAVPSLVAAVLMGLRTEFGGSPDHIGVSVVIDPTTPGTDKLPALLLHDEVPGGTGYLAKLASADDVWRMLYSAWRTVHDCECQNEGRQACHRCLLPYAAPWEVPHVSRLSAERHLRKLLTGSFDGPEPTPEMGWRVSDLPTSVSSSDESVLEQRFRAEVRTRLTGVGTVTEVPGATGNVMSISVGERRFTMRPQVDVLGSRPDFEFRGGGGPLVEIFADGFGYHATPEHNRVGDDADKRQALRLGGRQVLGVTMKDCENEAARRQSGVGVEPPWWLDEGLTRGLRGQGGFSQDAVDALTGGPFAFLSYVVSGGSRADLERFSDVVPAYFMAGAQRVFLAEGKTLRQAAAELICGAAAVPAATSSTMWWQHDRLGVMVAVRSPRQLDVCVVLDDRDPAADGFEESWREWLRVSNALIARSPEYETSIVTVNSVGAEPTSRAGEAPAGERAVAGQRADVVERSDLVDRGVAVELSPQWASVLQEADDSLAGLVRELAGAGVSVPDIGEEIAGIPTELSWPSARVVVLVGEQDGDAEELGAEGWTLVPADCDAVVAAVRGNDA